MTTLVILMAVALIAAPHMLRLAMKIQRGQDCAEFVKALGEEVNTLLAKENAEHTEVIKTALMVLEDRMLCRIAEKLEGKRPVKELHDTEAKVSHETTE